MTPLAAAAGCHSDAGGQSPPDGGGDDGGEIDAVGEDAPPEIDAAPDSPPDAASDGSQDAGSDAPLDSIPPEGWGLAFPDEHAWDMVTVGDRTYLLSWPGSGTAMRLRTIVDGQVTATQLLVPGAGRLGTDGQSLYVSLGFYGVVTLWNEQVGAAGQGTVVVAKLDETGQPSWRYVDTYGQGPVTDFQVADNGTSALLFGRESGGTRTWTIETFSADGLRIHQRTLPTANAFFVDHDGDVFVSGTLAAGASLEGHVAPADESYLIKLMGDTVGFTRFLPGITHEVVGIHAGDPMIASRVDADTHVIARHAGTNGAPLWTTQLEGGGAQFTRRVVTGGASSLYMFGGFQGRLDLSPTLRLDGQSDLDLYVAELDPSTGAARRAHHIGAAQYDYAADLEGGACPLVAGTLSGQLIHGQGVLPIPAGGRRAFVATACF